MVFCNNFVSVISVDGKILREDGNKVFLPFGSEYSILLKNKDNRKALVTVDIDGQNVSNDGLIVGGNSQTTLEGFMDNKMGITGKFRFIEKTKEISKFRGDKVDDGIITIKYRFEARKEYPPQFVPPLCNPHPWVIPYYPTKRRGPYDNITCNLVSACNTNQPKFGTAHYSPPSNLGITVPGSDSNQKFVYANIDTLESNEYTITIQLLGSNEDQAPVTKTVWVKSKLKCATCGKQNKSTFKYCGSCGTRLAC